MQRDILLQISLQKKNCLNIKWLLKKTRILSIARNEKIMNFVDTGIAQISSIYHSYPKFFVWKDLKICQLPMENYHEIGQLVVGKEFRNLSICPWML